MIVDRLPGGLIYIHVVRLGIVNSGLCDEFKFLLTDFRHLLGRGIRLMRGCEIGEGTHADTAGVIVLLALRILCRFFGCTVGSLDN